MAIFLVRVALPGVAEKDDAYGELDALMLQYDFTRSILGAEGHEFRLPVGTYDGESTMEADELRVELEEAIADSHIVAEGRASSESGSAILVVERLTASWAGLPPFEGADDDQ